MPLQSHECRGLQTPGRTCPHLFLGPLFERLPSPVTGTTSPSFKTKIMTRSGKLPGLHLPAHLFDCFLVRTSISTTPFCFTVSLQASITLIPADHVCWQLFCTSLQSPVSRCNSGKHEFAKALLWKASFVVVSLGFKTMRAFRT